MNINIVVLTNKTKYICLQATRRLFFSVQLTSMIGRHWVSGPNMTSFWHHLSHTMNITKNQFTSPTITTIKKQCSFGHYQLWEYRVIFIEYQEFHSKEVFFRCFPSSACLSIWSPAVWVWMLIVRDRGLQRPAIKSIFTTKTAFYTLQVEQQPW